MDKRGVCEEDGNREVGSVREDGTRETTSDETRRAARGEGIGNGHKRPRHIRGGHTRGELAGDARRRAQNG